MIAAHQPALFPENVICGVSSVDDGDMRFTAEGSIQSTSEVLDNRRRFLSGLSLPLENAVLVKVTYEGDNYCRYGDASELPSGGGMTKIDNTHSYDALATTEKGKSLFLPLADCVGAVIFDPVHKVLMVSHLGRHSIEQEGALRSIAYLTAQYGVSAAELLVWLSPSAGSTNYPLFNRGHKSLQEVAVEQLRSAGVTLKHIETSTVDTTTDSRYYSQSEFSKGNRTYNGRFAIVAMMS